MTPRIVSQIGEVVLVSAIVVLLFSAYRSWQGAPSTGLAAFGTLVLVLGIALRMRARSAAK